MSAAQLAGRLASGVTSGAAAGDAADHGPWISTTRVLDMAKGYEGGNGVVAIDFLHWRHSPLPPVR